MCRKESHSNTKFILIYYAFVLFWLSATAMHIPDGYLSPSTSLVMFLLVLPFWIVGIRRMRKVMNSRSVPVIAMVAAFCFVIMMFNIPLPGGTTGHAVGAALAAIILGPEIATIAVSMALIIQALLFGDGGILSIGANCFNMAVVMPYISYAVYRLFSRATPITSPRRVIGAGIGGWVGLTAAALFTAIEFGIQPLLFTSTNGTPLYAPYPMSITIPAMLIPHMLIASVVEGVVTALIVAFFQRTNVSILEMAQKPEFTSDAGDSHKMRWIWVGVIFLAVISPLGLLAPGTAWGEWSTQELSQLGLSTIPAGLAELSGLWGAPLAKYEVPALGKTNVGYILSALLGIVIIGIVVWLFSMLFMSNPSSKKES